jgi:hypothetical protein
MNRKDLDALNELYLSVYDGEQLNEVLGLPSFGPSQSQINQWGREGEAQRAREKGVRASTQRRDMGVVLRNGKYTTIYTKTPEALALANKLNKEEGRVKPTQRPAAGSPPQRPAAGSPPQRPAAGSGSTPPQRPAAKPGGIVLARKNNVTGTLDKSTGKFTEKNWTDTETQRYQTRAAQNAPKSSPTTPVASAPKPAIGKLGNTSFERRTPTSAELKAAQDARSKGASPEKALQAAQKTNLPTTGPTPATPDLGSIGRDLARANTVQNLNRAPAGSAAAKALPVKPAPAPTPSQIAGASQGIEPKPINNTKTKPIQMKPESYEWPSAKTIRDIAGAYASIYEAKKKVDQDQDGDNDFADVRVARMVASGVPKAKAIAMVKDKSYNEEVELWVNELLEEGYDLSDYTWEDMFEIYLDEATRMRKELGKEGEIATRQELARRSNAYQRSGSVDRTIAAAERGAKNPYVVRGKNETEAEHNKRKQAKSQTLTRLASNRRGSVRDKPRAGLRGYAAKVEGSDRDLQSARSSAMAAGTLTPRERKELNREAYAAYEFVASYLLENNFASTVDDANVIINNMSEGWFDQIMEEKKPLPVAKMKRKESKLLDNEEGQLQALRTDVGSKERKARMKELQRFDNINSVRTSVAKRGGKQQHSMPEIGRYKPKDED